MAYLAHGSPPRAGDGRRVSRHGTEWPRASTPPAEALAAKAIKVRELEAACLDLRGIIDEGDQVRVASIMIALAGFRLMGNGRQPFGSKPEGTEDDHRDRLAALLAFPAPLDVAAARQGPAGRGCTDTGQDFRGMRDGRDTSTRASTRRDARRQDATHRPV
jgi:hypothetical protein